MRSDFNLAKAGGGAGRMAPSPRARPLVIALSEKFSDFEVHEITGRTSKPFFHGCFGEALIEGYEGKRLRTVLTGKQSGCELHDVGRTQGVNGEEPLRPPHDGDEVRNRCCRGDDVPEAVLTLEARLLGDVIDA